MTISKCLQTKEDSQFILSKFTHEIRNPLALIDSELQLLADLHPEITAYRDWEVIQSNLSYIKDLLSDFSSYGNAGHLSLVPTALSAYFHMLTDSIRPSLEYLDIQLSVDIPCDLPTIPLDQRKFRQAFLNFIRNAQEAVPSRGGKIFITCKTLSEQKICLSISDNGCGLSKEQLQNVFTPFVTYKQNGTGLGLPIAKEIIESHGGSLQIESQKGQGCTLRIILGG